MAIPDIAVEGDLEQRHGQNLSGLGLRAVHLAAEAKRHLVDQVGVKEGIGDAGEQDHREAAPRQDLCGSGGQVFCVQRRWACRRLLAGGT